MLKSLPKISVITVCLNAGHLLPKTIDSVAEQTYGFYEHIIIDGASRDATRQVVNSYKPGTFRFVSERDSGLYDAMNKGINLALGDLVIFLNAGDYFVTKDVLKFYISKIKLEEADLFFGRIVWNDPKYQWICLSDHQNSVNTWDLKNSNFPHPATIYKKKLFQTIGLFNVNYPIAADYEWNVRALVLEKVKFQYVDIIVTVFFADGISNNEALASKHRKEIDDINSRYYKHRKLHEKFKQTKPSRYWKLIERVAAKYWDCKLNRV